MGIDYCTLNIDYSSANGNGQAKNADMFQQEIQVQVCDATMFKKGLLLVTK
jgi:hypothetical protein